MQSTGSRKEILGLFLPLYLPSFLFSFSTGLLIPILPLFAQDFHISYGLVGVVIAGDAMGMLVGDLPAGLLMRRIGQKSSMIIGLLLTGFSTTALFLAPNILIVVLLRLISGLGAALFSVSRHYFLTVITPPSVRGRVTSLYGGVFRMGRLFGPIVGGMVGAAFGLRYSFLVFGAVCLLGLLIAIRFLPHLEVPQTKTAGPRRTPWRQYGIMLRNKWYDLSTAGAGYMFMQIVRAGPPALIPLYAANYLNMTVDSIGLLVSLTTTLDMILFYPAGIMMDRWGRKSAILSSSFVLLLGMALIPFTRSEFALTIVGMIAGLGNGIGSGTMLALGSDLTPEENSSEFLGAWTLIGDVGNSSGPLLIGGLADVISLPVTGWIIASGGLVAVFIFSQLVPETLKKAAALPVTTAKITD